MFKRKEFSTETKRSAWERCGGACEGVINSLTRVPIPFYIDTRGIDVRRCNAPIDVGCFHYDHIDNVWTSQDNSLKNCQVLCIHCHKIKTVIDVKRISKTKRLIAGPKKSRNPLPFGKTSKWRKKINGDVVSR